MVKDTGIKDNDGVAGSSFWSDTEEIEADRERVIDKVMDSDIPLGLFVLAVIGIVFGFLYGWLTSFYDTDIEAERTRRVEIQACEGIENPSDRIICIHGVND